MPYYAIKNKNSNPGLLKRDGNDLFFYFTERGGSTSFHEDWSKWESKCAELGKSKPKEVDVDGVNFLLNLAFPASQFSAVEIFEVPNPGVYHPRINNNNIEFDLNKTGSDKYLDEIRSFTNIYSEMDFIFNYINPNSANLNAFGHKNRELLIVSCTEVEYLFLQFLKDNNYPPKDRYSTNDYVFAEDILKLRQYSVRLKMHPSAGEFSPFSNWITTQPTKSLDWYNSYNLVKHDRGGNFKEANLLNLVNAVAAIHILLEAQYGKSIFNFPFQSDLKSCFETSKRPIFNAKDFLLPEFEMSKGFKWSRSEAYFDAHPI